MTDSSAPSRLVRVVVVDDSDLARLVIQELLSQEPDFEVVGTASSGAEGVELVVELEPDIITMDLRMPGMDGLATTAQIMKRRPTPVLIVTSSDFRNREQDVFAAFKHGVVDVLEKPSPGGDPQVARSLVEKVRLLSRIQVTRDPLADRPSVAPPRRRARARRGPRVDAIGIAASTGGPRALETVLSALPADLPVPVFVAQHMSAPFMEGFVRWLDDNVDIAVKLGAPGHLAEPGEVLIAPGGANMVLVAPGFVRLRSGSLEEGILPNADVLFSSLAACYGRKTAGVVLTGIGRDGTEGMKSIKAAGGVTLVQDEGSCVVFGMPKAAVGEGVVDEIVALDQLAGRLIELAGAGRGGP